MTTVPQDVAPVLRHLDTRLLVDLTCRLVQIDSVYRPARGGNEEEVALYVAALLNEWGIPAKIEYVEPGRPNVMGVLKGTEPGKTLLFEGHTDVVTEGDPAGWEHPPFEARIVGDRIYGRGACDTKNNLAAALVVCKAIKDSGVPFKGQILMAVPVDEESRMIGIKQMINSGWCDDVDGAIICEPEENQLCITQKGAMRIVISGYGKMSHGAMPRAGVNPIPPLAEIVTRLMRLEAAECARHGEDVYLGWPSITPTIFHGPETGDPQINVLPANAVVKLDLRTTPAQSHAFLEQAIRSIVDEVAVCTPGFSATVEVLEDRPYTVTSMHDPVVVASANAYRMVTGKEPRYNGVPGATDGTFLWAWKNIPIVTYGAGGRTIPHQTDEYVEIPELIETAQIYAAAAMLYLNR